MGIVSNAAKTVLSDIQPFSKLVLKKPLRAYQLAAVRPVLKSIINQDGQEFVWIFSRQSGKNETVAQLCAYLLNIFQRGGGHIIHTAPTGDQVATGKARLEERLANGWNAGHWGTLRTPLQTKLGQAAVLWLSGHPQANVRGATAHHLIIFDESQDFNEHTAETVFAPMCASTNATRLYIGTTKTSNTYLARKRRELEKLQQQDGLQRVFVTDWRRVAAELPAYRRFVRAEIAKKGERHPSIVMEFNCEELDAGGGLFDARRRALMLGAHPPAATPHPLTLYVATLDVAGQDEGDPTGELANPGRDYTIAWIWEVDLSEKDTRGGPTYRAAACFADQGGRHFEGQANLAGRLLAWLQSWHVGHLVADASGVGLGLVAWLQSQLGEDHVTPFTFSSLNKAKLGVEFLAVIETGRFAMHTGPDDHTAAFWRQVTACTYAADPDKPLERGLRWSVPDNATYDTLDDQANPVRRPIHDDYLLAAALVSQFDLIPIGAARSHVVHAPDIFDGMRF